jgi:hypothetical protein
MGDLVKYQGRSNCKDSIFKHYCHNCKYYEEYINKPFIDFYCNLFEIDIFLHNNELLCKCYILAKYFRFIIKLWIKIINYLDRYEFFKILFDFIGIIFFNIIDWKTYFNETDNKFLIYWYKKYTNYKQKNILYKIINNETIIYKRYWSGYFVFNIINNILLINKLNKINEKTIQKNTGIREIYKGFKIKQIEIRNPEKITKEYKLLKKQYNKLNKESYIIGFYIDNMGEFEVGNKILKDFLKKIIKKV